LIVAAGSNKNWPDGCCTGSGDEEVAGFLFCFALDFDSVESDPSFFQPGVVWITLIRGLAVHACQEA
jgi:hypothetical protein